MSEIVNELVRLQGEAGEVRQKPNYAILWREITNYSTTLKNVYPDGLGNLYTPLFIKCPPGGVIALDMGTYTEFIHRDGSRTNDL